MIIKSYKISASFQVSDIHLLQPILGPLRMVSFFEVSRVISACANAPRDLILASGMLTCEVADIVDFAVHYYPCVPWLVMRYNLRSAYCLLVGLLRRSSGYFLLASLLLVLQLHHNFVQGRLHVVAVRNCFLFFWLPTSLALLPLRL